MYLPEVFRLDDDSALDVVARARLATVVVSTGAGFEATPLPWMLRRSPESTLLVGHVSKANPLARMLSEPVDAIVLVDGPDGYVSPSWYPSKVESGEVVPTWNYVSVHLHGRLSVIHDAEWLREMVESLTIRYESEREQPWSVDDAPADYLDRMLRGIVGLEFVVERVEGKAKLSQNRSEADRAGVIAGLRTEGADGLLGEMER
ncbi:MAG: FMN-binding negative transcriptional regulator [Ilumatobacteraceae bacterium]|nr:FMN-binding negative transcriptional regulator [Ilumatobacteraceae bacterium]